MALRTPVTAAPVDPTPQPKPARAGLLERSRVALAVAAALSCLYFAGRALEGSSSALPLGGDPVAGEAGSGVLLGDGVPSVNQDIRALASLARRAALERAVAAPEREQDRSGTPSGGASGGAGQEGSGGSGSDSGGQPGPEQPAQGLLPPLPAPLPDVDPDDVPELDPTGTLPPLPSTNLPELDPSLPTVESPVELP